MTDPTWCNSVSHRQVNLIIANYLMSTVPANFLGLTKKNPIIKNILKISLKPQIFNRNLENDNC